jgi:GT2 family glycosyltransferase
MSEPAKVGVVTVTYNSQEVIDPFMRCMLNQSCGNFTLYAIDNCSKDATLQRISHYPDSRVVLIANPRNVGVAEGNNQGIRAALQADCDYILLLNNDTEFDADLILTLCADCAKYQCDLVVPKIMYYDRPDVIWYAGGGFNRSRATGFHYGINCRDTGEFDEPRQVDYAPTCCMLIRRDVFRQVGLMDARYFVYFDDTDFCLRARRRGQKLYYTSSTRLLHKVGSLTGGDESPFSILFTTRNHVFYLAKNFGWLPCLYYLPLYQVSIVAKLFSGRYSISNFRASQTGFWKGVRMAVAKNADDRDRLVVRDTLTDENVN